MMLDITGSMSGSKISDLKAAAKDLVSIVIDDRNPEYAKIALAPFSEHVNVGGALYRSITGVDPENASGTCVRERRGSNRYKDIAPGPGNYFDRGPTSWCKPQTKIMPLSGDKIALKAHIDSFGTEGRTAGHLGTAWAWYMLSPEWNGVWSGGSVAQPYGDPNFKKIAVLMTDGEYNEDYSGDSSTTQARAICTNMKASGVEVYTVAFQLSAGSTAETTMRQCASSPSHFFNSTTGEELRQAFREIALQIATLRVAQ
jgi:uncharacterized protein YegL